MQKGKSQRHRAGKLKGPLFDGGGACGRPAAAYGSWRCVSVRLLRLIHALLRADKVGVAQNIRVPSVMLISFVSASSSL